MIAYQALRHELYHQERRVILVQVAEHEPPSSVSRPVAVVAATKEQGNDRDSPHPLPD